MGIMSVLGGNHVVCLGGNILIQSAASPQCGTQYQIDGWNLDYLQLNAETSIRGIQGGGTKAYINEFFLLTHSHQDKIADISQTTFSNAFSWMKMYQFHLRIYWSLFLKFKWTIFQYWFR